MNLPLALSTIALVLGPIAITVAALCIRNGEIEIGDDEHEEEPSFV